MNCIAIDDEPLALQLIQKYTDRCVGVKLVATFTDALIAQEYLEKNKIEVIFLDIQMPDINGIEFYKQLKDKPTAVIFTTAYNQFAVEGFNLNADDYLVKPFAFERFELAIERIKEKISLQKQKESAEGELIVKYNYAFTKIPFAHILFIEALDDYIKIHTIERKFVVLMSMKNVVEKLPSHTFVRIHRSYIANIDKVKSWTKNNLRIESEILPISASYQKDVMDLLENIS